MAHERAEAECATLLQSVQGQQKNVEKVVAFLPNAIGCFKALIDDLANVTQLQVDKARRLLRVLLGERDRAPPYFGRCRTLPDS